MQEITISYFQYTCTGTLHTLCSIDLSLQIEADSLFTGIAFPAELSNYMYICYVSEATRSSFRGCKYQNFSGGAPPDPPNLTVCYSIPCTTKTLKNRTIVLAPS